MNLFRFIFNRPPLSFEERYGYPEHQIKNEITKRVIEKVDARYLGKEYVMSDLLEFVLDTLIEEYEKH